MIFKKILVPLDGSESADNAFRCGLQIAGESGAALYVLSVADITEASYPLLAVNLSKDGFSTMQENARGILEKRKEEIPEGIRSIFLVRTGVPGMVITNTVEEESIDLVIMGNSGKGALSSFIMGSVSQYVIHHVKVPVLIIK